MINSEVFQREIEFDFGHNHDLLFEDHRLVDRWVVPGTVLLQQTLEQMAGWGGGAISQMTLVSPIFSESAGTLKWHWSTADDFEILHGDLVVAKGLRRKKSSEGEPLRSLIPPGSESILAPETYAKLAEVGYHYGPSLQWIQRSWKEADRTLFELQAWHGETLPSHWPLRNAALMDGVLQTIMVQAFSQQTLPSETFYLPYHFQKIESFAPLSTPLLVELPTSSFKVNHQGVLADAFVYNSDGMLALVFHGVWLKKSSQALFQKSESVSAPFKRLSSSDSMSFFCTVWIEDPGFEGSSSVRGLDVLSLLIVEEQEDGLAESWLGSHPEGILIHWRQRQSSSVGRVKASFMWDASSYEELEGIFQEIRKQHPTPSLIVVDYCVGLRGGGHRIQSTDALEHFHEQLLIPLLNLSRGLGKVFSRFPVRVQVVTSHDKRAIEPWKQASFSGMLAVIQQEYPRQKWKHLQMEASLKPSDVALVMDQERHLSVSYSSLSYDGKRRFIRVLEEVLLSSEMTLPLFREGGVYVITGGAGGVGLQLARQFSLSVQRGCLILLGRSPLSKEKAEFLNGLKHGQVQLSYVEVDITHEASLKRTLNDLRQNYGAFNGVFHLAGVLEDGWIRQKTTDSFRRVFNTKVSGAWLLDQLTQEDSLDFFVLFSSVVAVTGNVGQVDYAAANAFLDGFAHFRQQHRKGRTLSINWPFWNEGGMGQDPLAQSNPLLKQVGAVESVDAIHHIGTMLASGLSQVVVLGKNGVLAKQWESARPRQLTSQPILKQEEEKPVTEPLSPLQTLKDRREHVIGMPQMALGGLSENFILKELGDIHWKLICDAFHCGADEIIDSEQNRLYASFVRIRMESSHHLKTFKENQKLVTESSLSRFGQKMFFSKAQSKGPQQQLETSLMTLFVARKTGNQSLTKATPLQQTKPELYEEPALPEFGRQYLSIKKGVAENQMIGVSITLGGETFPLSGEILCRMVYVLSPYYDINGANLLYYAAYPQIHDHCERKYLHHLLGTAVEHDWATESATVARDIFYYGNVDIDSDILFSVNHCEWIEGYRIKMVTTLSRSSDQQKIATIFTLKQLVNPENNLQWCQFWNAEIPLNFSGFPGHSHALMMEKQTVTSSSSSSSGVTLVTVSPRDEFYEEWTPMIIPLQQMLAKLLGVDPKELVPNADLRDYGLESVLLAELSEQIAQFYQIPINTSRLYSYTTIQQLAMAVGSLLTDSKKVAATPAMIEVVKEIHSSKRQKQVRSGPSDIAIIGMSGRFPQADGVDALWEHLIKDHDCITEIPADRWDWKDYFGDPSKGTNRSNSKWGGFLKDIRRFDADFFKISPAEAELMDPQQRILLEVAWHCIEDAGYPPSSLSDSNTGVFIGVFSEEYLELLEQNLKTINGYFSTGTSISIIPNRVSHFFNFHGPSVLIDTACSSSLVAVHQAVQAILEGDCELALAGGVNVCCTPTQYLSLSNAGMLSPDGHCKTFDASANGYVRGEGAGLILLKDLSHAIEDGDRIYGVIKSTAINHGGHANTLTSPNPAAQTSLLVRAYQKAEVDPARVGYIETHGTGTKLGDPIEINALKDAFSQLLGNMPMTPFCALGALKSQIGHLEAAAGIAGLIKVLMMLKHGKIPGILNLRQMNPRIELENSPFSLSAESSDWKPFLNSQQQPLPRIAGVSSFGFGGVNSHVVLEEYLAPTFVPSADSLLNRFSVLQIFVLSAKNPERLQTYLKKTVTWLQERLYDSQISLADLNHTSQMSREALRCRIAIVASSKMELLKKLEQLEHPEKLFRDGSFEDINLQAWGHFLKRGEGSTNLPLDFSKASTVDLAKAWISGSLIPWHQLHPLTRRQRIPFIDYPFVHDSYWYTDLKSTAPHHFQQEDILAAAMSMLSSENPSAPESSKSEEPVIEKTTVLEPAVAAEIQALHHQELLKKWLRQDLQQQVAQVLKLDPKHIEPHVDLGDYGFDSLAYNSLSHSLNQFYSIDLTAAIFFEHSQINSLVNGLLEDNHSPIEQHYQERLNAEASVTVTGVVHPGDTILLETEGQEGMEVIFSRRKKDGRRLQLLRRKGDRRLDEASQRPERSFEQRKRIDVAIIGIGGQFPQSKDLRSFWDHLLHEKSLVTEVPEERWNWRDHFSESLTEFNKTHSKWAGVVSDIDQFDADFFQISAKEARLMDPQQRILLQTIWQTFEDAGYRISDFSNQSVGLFVGASTSDYAELLQQEHQSIEAHTSTGMIHSLLPNRISYLFNWHGPSEAIDTACSSSLVAMHHAVKAIQSGECEVAVAAGVNALLSEKLFISFSKAGMLSPDGRCKTFDSSANGYVRGEGAGALLLKPLAAAIAAGDPIYAVVKGTAVNHGGKSSSLTAPNPAAQASVIARAYQEARIHPQQVSYIEAHGTGTALGDPIEVEGLQKAFAKLYETSGTSPTQHAYCGLGSVKSNIGHLEAAAGMAGLIKILLAMKHQTLPATLHFQQLNPQIQLENSPFYIVNETQSWMSQTHTDGTLLPKVAGISSFGFGGTNAHVVLEEYITEIPTEEEDWTAQWLPFSAKSPQSLRGIIGSFAEWLQGEKPHSLENAAYTLQTGRESMSYRVVFLATSHEEVLDSIQCYLTFPEKPLLSHQGFQGQVLADQIPFRSKDPNDRNYLESLIHGHRWDHLAELWTTGVEVDWKLFHQGRLPRRISLPTYVFQKKRYWIPQSKAVSIPLTHTNRFSLPDKKLLSGKLRLKQQRAQGLCWEYLILPEIPLVSHHEIQGVSTFPGAGFLALVQDALLSIQDELLPVQNKEIRTLKQIHFVQKQSIMKPVLLSVLLSQQDSRIAFEIQSEAGIRLVEGFYEDHTTEKTDVFSVESLKEQISESLSVDAFYEKFQQQGLDYGPYFQAIQSLWKNDHEALAWVSLSEKIHSERSSTFLHPVILDAAFQTTYALRTKNAVAAIPFSIESYQYSNTFPSSVYVYVIRQSEELFDLKILTESGQLCAQIQGLLLRNVGQQSKEVDAPTRSTRVPMYVPCWTQGNLPTPSSTAIHPSQEEDSVLLLGTENLFFLQRLKGILHPVKTTEMESFSEFSQTTKPHQRIYFLGAIDRNVALVQNTSALDEILQSGVMALFDFVQKQMNSDEPITPVFLTVLTNGVFSVAGEAVTNPYGATLFGFLRTLVQEAPQFQVRCVDLPSGLELLESSFTLQNLLGAAIPPGIEICVFRNEAIYHPAWQEAPVQPTSGTAFRQRGVYLLVGGSGGIGLVLSRYLASTYQARLVWIGRQALTAVLAKRIAEIQQIGGEVLYLQADVSSLEDLQKAIVQTHHRWGKIHGVLHAAMVLEDKPIETLTPAVWWRVLTPKVHGSLMLAQAFAQEPLDWMVFFSSIQSMAGNPGQAPYGAASSFQDALAHFLHQQSSYPVKVINWGYWGEVGATGTADYAKRLQKQGIEVLSSVDGILALEQYLASDFSQSMILNASAKRLQQLQVISSSPQKSLETQPLPPSQIVAFQQQIPVLLDESQSRMVLQSELRQRVASLIEQPPESLDLHKAFSEYGIDSILAIELIRNINQWLGTSLKTSLIFDYGSITALAHYLEQHHLDAVSSLGRNQGLSKPTLTTPRVTSIPNQTNSRIGSLQGPSQFMASPQKNATALLLTQPISVDSLQLLSVSLQPPGSHQVQVQVEASALNFSDILCVEGFYPNMPEYPFIPGSEIAGTVCAIGSEVSQFKVGDAVFGLTPSSMGGHSTIVTVDALLLTLKPATLSFNEACSLPIAFLTAFYAFSKMDVISGDSILIQSAAGGVGSVAIQLAHAAGMTVYATVGSDEKRHYLEQLGVQHIINYRNESVVEKVLEWTHQRGVHAVLNMLPGEFIQQGLNLLAPGGHYLEIAMAGLQQSKPFDLSHLIHNQTFSSIDLRKLIQRKPEILSPSFQEMKRQLDTGQLKPIHSTVFELAKIQDAYRYLKSRQSVGKVLLDVSSRKDAFHTTTESIADTHPIPLKSEDAVAIIGMSGQFPGASDVQAFWENLKSGVSSIETIPASRWNADVLYHPDPNEPGKTVSRWGGFLDGIYDFDAPFFSLSGSETERCDPQQRLFLEESWKALEDAGYATEAISETSCGVFVGVAPGDYTLKMQQSGIEDDSRTFIGNQNSILAARIAYFLNLKGPSLAIDTACSSSLITFNLASQSLLSHECDMALAGGVFISNTPHFFTSFSQLHMLSPTGKCSTFDEKANGFVPGEAVGVCVLKRLSQALIDGDRIYGIIRGIGSNQDGKTNGITAPSGRSQQQLLQSVYQKNHFSPETLQYVEAHGTGTPLGDPIEIESLSQAFGRYTSRQQYCAIGSVKTNIGHTITAAGVASVIKVLLMLKHQQIPPSLNFDQPNPHINFEKSPFYVNTQLQSWKTPDHTPRRAAISSFGFSGTNCHLLLEEAPTSSPLFFHQDSSYLILLSAKTEESLQQRIQDLMTWTLHPSVAQNPQWIHHAAHTLALRRGHFPIRCAVIASNSEDLRRQLQSWQPLSSESFPINSSWNNEPHLLLKTESFSIHNNPKKLNILLTSLASGYQSGVDQEWKQLYSSSYQIVDLPIYPFTKKTWNCAPTTLKTRESSNTKIPFKETNIHPSDLNTGSSQESTQRNTHAVEKSVRHAIGSVLKCPPQDVPRHTPWLDLGIDSILAAKITQQIEEALELKLYPNEFLEQETLSQLLDYMENEGMTSPKEEDETTSVISMKMTENLAPKASPKKLLFLLSTPRAGSTLLRVMLTGHSQIFAPPELHLLQFSNMQQRAKSLKEHHQEFLKEGLIQTIQELQQVSLAVATETVLKMEQEAWTISAVYQFLVERCKKRYFVDKSPTYGDRIEILQAAEKLTIETRYLFLVRHPLAVMDSFIKNRFDALFRIEGDPWKASEALWNRYNQNILDFLESCPTSHQQTLSYEALVEEPEPVLRQFCQWLEIDFEPSLLTPYEGHRLIRGAHPDSLPIGDPNFLKHQHIDASLADAWKKKQNRLSQLSQNTLAFARQLGYAFQTESALPLEQPLSPVQQTALRSFKNRHWHVVLSFSLNDPTFSLERFDQVIKNLVSQHEALRYQFHYDHGQWLQEEVLPTETPALYEDWTTIAWNTDTLKALEIKLCQQTPLLQSALYHCALVKTGPETYQVIWVLHHLIADGYSASFLYRSFIEHCAGLAKPPITATVPYSTYVTKLMNYYEKTSLESHHLFWKQHRSTVRIQIPVDWNKKDLSTASEKEVHLHYSLKKIAGPKPWNPPRLFEHLAVALYQLVARHSNTTLPLIAHRVHQRALPTDISFYNTVGLFATDLPLKFPILLPQDSDTRLKEFRQAFEKISRFGISYDWITQQQQFPYCHQLTSIRLNYQPSHLFSFGENVRVYATAAPEQPRLYDLDLIVRTQEDDLWFIARYSKNQYKANTIRHFLNEWMDDLEKITRIQPIVPVQTEDQS